MWPTACSSSPRRLGCAQVSFADSFLNWLCIRRDSQATVVMPWCEKRTVNYLLRLLPPSTPRAMRCPSRLARKSTAPLARLEWSWFYALVEAELPARAVERIANPPAFTPDEARFDLEVLLLGAPRFCGLLNK